MTQETQHFRIHRCAGQGHVSVSKCSVNLQVKSRLEGGLRGAARFFDSVNAVCGKVKIQPVSSDLRCRDL